MKKRKSNSLIEILTFINVGLFWGFLRRFSVPKYKSYHKGTWKAVRRLKNGFKWLNPYFCAHIRACVYAYIIRRYKQITLIVYFVHLITFFSCFWCSKCPLQCSKTEKMHFFEKKLGKCLVNSKKIRTFASWFRNHSENWHFETKTAILPQNF